MASTRVSGSAFVSLPYIGCPKVDEKSKSIQQNIILNTVIPNTFSKFKESYVYYIA